MQKNAEANIIIIWVKFQLENILFISENNYILPFTSLLELLGSLKVIYSNKTS